MTKDILILLLAILLSIGLVVAINLYFVWRNQVRNN